MENNEEKIGRPNERQKQKQKFEYLLVVGKFCSETSFELC